MYEIVLSLDTPIIAHSAAHVNPNATSQTVNRSLACGVVGEDCTPWNGVKLSTPIIPRWYPVPLQGLLIIPQTVPSSQPVLCLHVEPCSNYFYKITVLLLHNHD